MSTDEDDLTLNDTRYDASKIKKPGLDVKPRIVTVIEEIDY